ncbi:MAG: polyhydroxyalkanoate synthesis repressor PhaR, partial [Pseudomonadota bacterium]
MLRDGQSKVMENMTAMNPMAKMPGFEMMQAQQEAFVKAMTGGLKTPWTGASSEPEPAEKSEDLDAIKKQLAELQDKLSKLS